MSWVESSFLLGHWVSEEPHECTVGRGLPRYHRLRAKAAMESPDQSCALPSLASNNTSAASKVKSGGIFSGWTMCVRVKKSTDNRSFRRVLGAAGAVVVSSSDLTAYRDRLNLVLCDHESVGVLRQVLGPCTPIAHHYFLRDVLLHRVDPANIQPYIYPPNTVPNLDLDRGPAFGWGLCNGLQFPPIHTHIQQDGIPEFFSCEPGSAKLIPLGPP
ncbi:hypothetical protein FHG87_024794 [Trinorchestia longiramus]|nr:hypothetical protein FHG87_024794 [Trinorchestia longiramus]